MWLQYGVSCTACINKCVDPPTPQEPWTPPIIGGKELHVTECPKKFCGGEARNILRFTELANNGHLPVAGGALDQSQGFLTCLEFVIHQERLCKNKLKISNG